MDPEKLKSIIEEFYYTLAKNFEVGPTGLILPPKIFSKLLEAFPPVMGGDGNNVAWTFKDFGSFVIRKG